MKTTELSSPVDLDKLVHEIVDQSTFVATTGAQVTVRPELGTVWGHESTVGQCISSILNNALTFAKPGTSPVVEIWRDDQHGAPRLWIRDEGVGIPDEQHEKIFRMFEQGGPAMKKETGEGLVGVKQAMEGMGGLAGLLSQPDKGTAFFLQFATGPTGPT